jgi:hypothetical protein
MLFSGLRLAAFPAGQASEFSKMGFGNFTDIMVRNMSSAWLHAALLAFISAGLAFVVWKGFKQAKWVAAAFVGVLAVDSLVLTSHYFQSTDIAALKKGNVVTNFLKKNQGNERIFFMDQGGLYNQWLASDGPYHDLNLFNVWQMSRMPADYKEFLGTVGRNQIRLWELAAIKYVAAPAGMMQQLRQNPEIERQFQPVLNYQVPTAQGMREDVLLEFNASIPRFALFSGWESISPESQCKLLASPRHDIKKTVLLNPSFKMGTRNAAGRFQPLDAQVTKKKATLIVRASVPSILRFSQYYQPGWRVFVDGKPAELLQVDFLCMGVAVPPGEHEVEFRCISGVGPAVFVLLVFLGSLSLAVGLLHLDRKAAA